MPPAIPAIAAAISGALAWSAASAAWIYAISYTFVYAAGMQLLNRAVSALAPKKKGGRGRGLELNYAGSSEPRRIIYGMQKVGGMMTIPPFCTGNDGKMVHLVITLAGHEVNDITDVYFDQEVITDGTIGAVSGTDNDGVVSSGNFTNVAWIRRKLGTSTQTADYILTQAYPAGFTSDYRGRGIAYMALRLKYDKNAFASGLPQITAMVYGKKVYDPRDGAQSATNAATWTYSTNPALATRDFLVNEIGFDNDEIDDTLVAAAANACDQTVAIPTASTQARYTCNITMFATEQWEESLRLLIDTMHGRAVFQDGKWRLYAGVWDTPSIAITKADWVSPTIVRSSVDRAERWNAVRVFYVDPDRNWQRVECYPRRNTTYETSDGGERIWREVEMPGCLNEYEAQRHGELFLRQSRNQTRITGKLRPEFIKLAPWDTVSVTDDEYGWSSKTFRVVSMDIDPSGSVSVALVEEGSAAWTDLAEGEYNAQTTAPTIDPGASLPGTPTTLVASGGRGSIHFSWDPGSEDLVGQTYRLIQGTNSGDASVGSEVWRGLAYQADIATDTTTRWYWVQGVVGSYLSAYYPNTFGVAAVASGPPGDGTPGTYAPALTLQADGYVFKFSGSGTALGVNTINFNALLDALPGATAEFYAKNFMANGTALNSYQLSGTGNSSRGLHINSFYQGGSTAYATVVASVVGGYNDIVTIAKLVDGEPGSGTPGADAIAGYLTNEAITLPSSNNGYVPSYSGASGLMVLFKGVNSINVNSITFSVAVESPVGLTSAASINGAYAVTGGLGTSDPYGAVMFRGAYDGTNIDKWFWISKALAGQPGTDASTASLMSLRATAQSFRYSGSGTSIGVNTIGFDAELQNLSGTVAIWARNYLANGTLINSVGLSGTGNNNRGFHINSFTQAGSTAYATIVATLGGFLDQITVVRLQEGIAGSVGSPGLDSVVAYLTNENITLPASSNGTVAASNYLLADGYWLGFEGITPLLPTSVTYTIPTNNSSLSMSFVVASGYYSVGGGMNSYDLASVTLRGQYKGVNYDKVLTVSKAKAGNTGAVGSPAYGLALIADAQAFRYSGSGTSIGVNTISFDANLQNLSGTIGIYANNYLANGTLINSVALSGTGNSNRGFHVNSFTRAGSTAYATIVATLTGGWTDRVTVVRLQEGAGGVDGAAGTDAIVGLLTNEVHTLPSSSNGYVPGYGGAIGEFQVFKGTTRVSVSSITFTTIVKSPSTLTAAITANGSYSITAGIGVSNDYGAATYRAAAFGANIDKVFTVGKSLGGETGPTGPTGPTGDSGGIGPPGGNLIANGDMLYVNTVTGRLAGWDGSTVNHTYGNYGVNSNQCLVVNSTASNIQLFNESIITLDPLHEVVDYDLWIRGVNSGMQIYLSTECLNHRGQTIGAQHGFFRGVVQAFNNYTAGSTTLRVQKTKKRDLGFEGYHATVNYNYLVIPMPDGVSPYYEDRIMGFPHQTDVDTAIQITAINTTASTSYDQLTLAAGLPLAVNTWDHFAIGVTGGTYRYPYGTTTTITSAWMRIQYRLAGLDVPFSRFSAYSTENGWTHRSGTQSFRFGMLVGNAGVDTILYIDKVSVKKRAFASASNLIHDPQMIMGGGAWMWNVANSQLSSSTPAIRFSPYSGHSGGGCFFITTGSAYLDTVRVGGTAYD